MREVQSEKLRALLNYWIEHNREHASELEEWAGRAKSLGRNLSSEILQAAQQLEKANEYLARALESLSKSP